MLPGLGLNHKVRKSFIQRVNIIFYTAATVQFYEKLKVAMQINVKAGGGIVLP